MSAENEHIYFINQLYRDFLLPTILGADTSEILYWAGKKACKQYALSSFADLQDFCQHAQLGQLELLKQKRHNATYELTGQTVTDRINSQQLEFGLEAGMLAQVVSQEVGQVAECHYTIDQKKQTATLLVQWD